MKTKSKILSAILSVSILSASLSAFVSGSLGVQAAESSPTVSANKYKLKDNIQDGVILHCFDWKDEAVNLDTLVKVALFLDCGIDDILEFEEESEGDKQNGRTRK